MVLFESERLSFYRDSADSVVIDEGREFTNDLPVSLALGSDTAAYYRI